MSGTEVTKGCLAFSVIRDITISAGGTDSLSPETAEYTRSLSIMEHCDFSKLRYL